MYMFILGFGFGAILSFAGLMIFAAYCAAKDYKEFESKEK